MITFNDITAEHSEHTFCVYQMLQRALLEADADIRRAEQALLAMRANRQRLHDTCEHTFALYKAQTQEEKSQ